MSFAAILRTTLDRGDGATRTGQHGDEGATTLHCSGDEAAVRSSIERARRASRPGRQGSLALPRRPPATRRALRAATSLDDLAPSGTVTGADYLAAEGDARQGREDHWLAIERAIAGRGATDSMDPELARTREWLLGSGRALVRLDRHRRFAVSLRGRTLAGELERVWIASGPGTQTRVLIGVRDRAHAEIECRVVLRALGLKDAAVAALVREPALALLTAAP